LQHAVRLTPVYVPADPDFVPELAQEIEIERLMAVLTSVSKTAPHLVGGEVPEG
jgi:hypothetical protein